MFIDSAFIPVTQQDDGPATIPEELRDLAALLAWRRVAQEAVVPVVAILEAPAAFRSDIIPASRRSFPIA